MLSSPVRPGLRRTLNLPNILTFGRVLIVPAVVASGGLPRLRRRAVRSTNDPRCGLTLMELVVVLAILVALAAIVVPLVSLTTSNAQENTTKATMQTVRDLILGQYRTDMKDDVLAQFEAAKPATPGAVRAAR